jgi:hypothetical protein
MTSWPRLNVVVSCLAALLLTGCFANPVQQEQITDAEYVERLVSSALTTDKLSVHSMKVIRTLDLVETWEDDPRAVLPLLREENSMVPEWERGMVRAEVSYLLGRRAKDPLREGRRWFLDTILEAVAAVRSYGGVGDVKLDPRFSLLVALYGRGLSRVFALTLKAEGHPSKWKSLPSNLGSRELRLATSAECWKVDDFDQYVVADEIEFTGLLNRHREYGLGLPLIGVKDNTTPTGRKRPEMPPTIYAAVTAGLKVLPDGALELSLYDPDRIEALVKEDGTRLPLAADRSAPIALQFARSDLRSLENKSLMNPEVMVPLTGLYLSEPYDPDKIPLVLVHGLWSSPLAWRQVWNEIRGDAYLRERYQIWFYAYPTGLPILINGWKFKKAMAALRAKLDPEGDDPAMQDMVYVGHSMGGLISKLMVKDSGTTFWDIAFRVPPEKLKLSGEHREALKEILFYEPHPYIKRVVFMAVPHGGSSMAQGLVGAVGSSMITLPEELVEPLEKIAKDNRKATRLKEGEDFEVSNSIDNLSPKSPTLIAMKQIPYAEGLPYHSLIGDVSGKGGGPGTSDGVVPYESAHIGGAASELVVKSDHGVPLDPAAMLELRRILRLHLEEK